MKDIKNKLFANMNVNVNVNTNTKGSSNNGFTIIEVALVLAIAGLIFLVVFLALPALQNSQKDTARKQDVGRVVSAIEQFESDGNNLDGIYGSGWYDSIYDNSGAWNDGKLGAYMGKLSVVTNVTIEHGVSSYVAWLNYIDIYVDRTCAPTGSTAMPVSTGDAAVVVKLSSGNYYCASV